MRILVFGGRDFGDRTAMFRALDAVKRKRGLTCIIQGGAKNGADSIARVYAKENGIRLITVRADWSEGKEAGRIRDDIIIEKGKPEAAIAFPRANGKNGPATRDMIQRLQTARIPIWEPLASPSPPSKRTIGAGTEFQEKAWKYGAVYIIGALVGETINAPFKVGMVGCGNAVGQRLRDIQTGSAKRLAVAHIQPAEFAASAIEFMAHRFLKQYRLSGEWFDCSLELAIDAVRRAAQQEASAHRRPLHTDDRAMRSARRGMNKRRTAAIGVYRSALD